MTFGEKLYKLRKAQDFSQEALAEKLHTSRQAVSKWENDNGYPETEKIILISKLFQISLDDLLIEEREMDAESDAGCRDAETSNWFLLYYKKKFLWIAAACGLIAGCNAVSYGSTEPSFYELTLQPLLAVVSGITLLSVVLYVILKQNPYRNLRNKELLFAEDVRKELQDEFSKMKKVLLAGIVVCLAAVGISEMYSARDLSITAEALQLLSEAQILRDNVIYMMLAGVCVFVMVFCAGVYWSYSVLLRNQ